MRRVYPKRSRRGFTLIELITAIGIIVILTGISIPFFRNFAKNNDLDRAALGVRSAILEARSLALAPNNPTGGIDSYQIVFNPTSDSKRYYVREALSSTAIAGKDFRLPSTIDFDPAGFVGFGSPADKRIAFSIEKQGKITFPNPTNGIVSMRLKSTQTSITKTIQINTQSGAVEIQ